jgi:hypothetical protein
LGGELLNMDSLQSKEVEGCAKLGLAWNKVPNAGGLPSVVDKGLNLVLGGGPAGVVDGSSYAEYRSGGVVARSWSRRNIVAVLLRRS